LATKIRLKRIGRRNRPFYRLIVIDSRKRRDGAAIEEIGWYNPIDKDHSYEIKSDRLLHWLEQGAIASNAAKKLMKREGLSLRWHLMQQGVDGKEIEKEMKKWELNREEVLALRKSKEDAEVANKKKKAESSDEIPSEEKPVEDSSDEVASEEKPVEDSSDEVANEEKPVEDSSDEVASEEKPVEDSSDDTGEEE